ncbi:hypothetical protein AJ79_08158 [Helicocarpus griseus UAMH5409]|uniref:BHLH domain-containing protein n=1 Tax=Helicocarpus griseus UAMH5409 TaxID=1447875 RepID=A0A2B7WVX2_9EURO|nr:hypothetical protein AJ79_08158 [Helicocarpus griseus UAMH5409]
MPSAPPAQASSSSSSSSSSPSASMSPNPSESPSARSASTVQPAPAPGSNQGPPSVSMTSSASPQPNALSSVTEKEKPRLTEQEKKNNHIASEQKRRAAIREGFDRLTELVPGLEGQGRSEGVVLRKTVDFMQTKLQERRELVAEIEKRGGSIDDTLRR